MINVTIYKKNELYSGIKLSGHSGYAPEGEDIVCAAVSSLSINTLNSIEVLTSDKFYENVDETRGFIEFHLTEEISHDAQILMLSLILGLQSVAKSNRKYIKLTLEEV